MVANVDVNLAQVRRGMAWAYVQYATDRRIFRAERKARAAKRGLWADAHPVPPWVWRHGK
jgi:endonuclease YncB( thermonuclease family)